MKLFIDTANIEEIRTAASWGIIDGVTTNPSLIAKEGRNFKQVVREICEIVDGPISAEVVSLKAEEMVKEAQELAKIHKNVVIKVPLTEEGLKAIKTLSQESIKTNATLIFSANQALLAAKCGAAYASPFVGRLDDISHQGMELVKEIVRIYQNYGYKTEIIVASIRHPLHVKESALVGAQIATVPFKVLQQMTKHALTDIGIKKFLEDWKALEEKKKE